jgi:hypothetical protein
MDPMAVRSLDQHPVVVALADWLPDIASPR